MNKKAVKTTDAPAAIGPYEQAVLFGNLLFSSGQIALNPKTGAMDGGDIKQETQRVMQNIKAILHAEGLTFNHIIKTTVYLADMGHFADMNSVYETFFPESNPARSCVQVAALPKNALVEIDFIAHSEGSVA